MADACYNVAEPDPVVGGLPFFSEEDDYWISPHQGRGTLGTLASYNDDPVGVTVLHIVQDLCSDDPDDWSYYQYCRDFGDEAADYDRDLDSVLINFNENYSAEAKIRDPIQQTDEDVVGYYSQTYVNWMANNQENVLKAGIATGRTTGPITESDIDASPDPYADCVDLNGEGIEIDHHIAHGDSGSMVYTEDENNDMTLVGMLHAIGDPNDDDPTCSSWDVEAYGEDPVGPAAFSMVGSHTGLEFYHTGS